MLIDCRVIDLQFITNEAAELLENPLIINSYHADDGYGHVGPHDVCIGHPKEQHKCHIVPATEHL